MYLALCAVWLPLLMCLQYGPSMCKHNRSMAVQLQHIRHGDIACIATQQSGKNPASFSFSMSPASHTEHVLLATEHTCSLVSLATHTDTNAHSHTHRHLRA